MNEGSSNQLSYYRYECSNLNLDAKALERHLRYNQLDYDQYVDLMLEESYDMLKGYTIALFTEYNGQKLGYPFFKIVTAAPNYGTDVKVVLIGSPLYKHQRESYWELIRQGYIPMGIQSYRSYPMIE